MAKRVSLKGQGAAIFFGGPTPHDPSRSPAEDADQPVGMDSPERVPPEALAKPQLDEPELHSSDQTTDRPVPRPSDLPGQPIGRTILQRPTARHAFELYQDQVDELRRIALQDKLAGGPGNMSEMVRAAIDIYLAGQGRSVRK